MPRRRRFSALHPSGAMLLSDGDHVLQAVPQIVPFFNDGSPGRPHHRPLRQRQDVVKSRHVLPMQLLVQRPFHVVRRGGSLGVHVEHDERVKSVSQRNALHALQRRIQCIRSGGGGVDADADEWPLPPCAQNIPVLRVDVRYKQPLLRVVFLVGFQSPPELLGKPDVPQRSYIHGRYVLHSFSLSL